MVQNTEFLNPDEDIDNDVDINSNQTTLNIGEKKSCKVIKGSKDTLIQYLLHIKYRCKESFKRFRG